MTERPRLAAQLDLQPHPEGGWFRETWRSPVSFLPPGYDGHRSAATAIYYLLHPGEESRWHLVRSDELWFWHGGGPLTLRLGGNGSEPRPPQQPSLEPRPAPLQPGTVLLRRRAASCFGLRPLVLRMLPLGFSGLRVARIVRVLQRPSERRDESLGIGSKALVCEAHGVAPRQWPNRVRQLIRQRHLGLTNQHRDNALVLLEGRFDLDADKIIRIVQPPPARLVVRVNPAPSDHRYQDVALRDLLLQDMHEVETRLDVIHIHEQLVGRKSLLQPPEKRLRKTGIVAPAIVDEYLAGHLASSGRKMPRTLSCDARAFNTTCLA